MMTVVRISVAMSLLLFLVVPVGAWNPLDVTSDPLLRMPGSQPGDGIQLTGPNATSVGQTGFICTDCHADGENPQDVEGNPVTTGFFWQGSMMSQAARDPIFWAAMTVAGQDSIWGLGNPNAMDLCLRCHFPEGWVEGRSSGPDGTSGLNASLMVDSDQDGVHCGVCHRMYDPFFADQVSREGTTDWEEDVAFDFTPLLNQTFVADDIENDNVFFLQSDPFFGSTSNLPFYYEAPYSSYETNGSGQFFFAANPDVTIPDPQEESAADANKRGPFADPENIGHSFLYSRYHKSKYFCSTCHDVSNPALANLGLDPSLVDQSGGTHQISEQYDAGKFFHVERTFSEFILSAYGADGGASTNSEFQSLGASNVTHAGTCQDCHMRDVVGVGAPGGTTRPRSAGPHPDSGSPLHNLQGGNLWTTQILASIDPDGPVYDATNEAILTNPAAAITLDLSLNNLPKGFSSALLNGSIRAEQQLILAAAIKNVVYDPETGALSFRILNNTGHKLISGFPEGRRMWVNIKASDDINPLLYEVNPYDEAAGTLQGLHASYTTDTNELPLPGNLNPLTQTYADELVYEMHPSSTLTGEEETFHFVLADGRYKDNRIPPKGFDIANAPTRESEPVWHGVSASDYFFAPEYAGGYDQVNLQIVPGATSVTVTLYYQGTSREYLEFLRDEINGTATTLKEPTLAQGMGSNTDPDPAYLIQSDPFFANMKDWGDTIWSLWKHNHGLDGSTADVPGITPYAMASVVAINALGGDNDLDGLTDKYEINTGTDPFNTDTDGDTVNDNTDAFPLDANLSVATPEATVSPSSIDFGTVNQATSAVITLMSTGNADLTINKVTALAAPFSIDAENCTTLSPRPPNASCTVTVTYTPSGSSTDLDTLLIDTGVSIGDDVQVALSGTSDISTVPDISLSDSIDPADDNTLPFGSWTANMLVEASINVTNNGNADLSLGTVAAIDSLVTPFTISADTCSDANIAPAASCIITVQYQSAIVGTFNDSFDIPSSDPDTPSFTIALSATALPTGQNNAPESPALLNPASGQTTASTDVTFTWELSQDPDNDPVTYEVVYSTDQGFTTSDIVTPVTAMVVSGGLMFALIGLPLFSQRRHRTMMLMMMLAMSTWLMVACDSSSGGSSTTNTTPVTPVTGTEQATATGLTASTTYYWKVVANDDHGNKTESEVRSFTTP